MSDQFGAGPGNQAVASTSETYPSPIGEGDLWRVSESEENPIKEKSFNFALEIVRLYQKLQDKKEYVLSRQILRSGTSIGANVEEATAAESRRDFVHKLSIAQRKPEKPTTGFDLIDSQGSLKSIDLGPSLDESHRAHGNPDRNRQNNIKNIDQVMSPDRA